MNFENGGTVDGKVYNETTRQWEEFNGDISSYVCWPKECGQPAEVIEEGNTLCLECRRIRKADGESYARTVGADHE